MKRTNLLILTAILIILGMTASASANSVTGKVTTWEGGSVSSSPVEKPLQGATVIIGRDLNLNVGSSGMDTVSGEVLVKVQTDSKGAFTANVPAGKYTMIIWKQRYTPSTYNITSPGTANGTISVNKQRILHTNINYK